MSNPAAGRPATAKHGDVASVKPPGENSNDKNADHAQSRQLLAGLVVRVHSGEPFPQVTAS